MYIYAHIYVYVYMCIYTYICIYICIYVYVYIYVCIFLEYFNRTMQFSGFNCPGCCPNDDLDKNNASDENLAEDDWTNTSPMQNPPLVTLNSNFLCFRCPTRAVESFGAFQEGYQATTGFNTT